MSDILTGWSSPYYQLPPGATELQDLIEHKEMNFAVGNIFKACYRLGEKQGTDATYDLEKIIWFAQRELARHKQVLARYPFVRGLGPGAILPDEVWSSMPRDPVRLGWPAPRCPFCQEQPCSCNRQQEPLKK